MIVSKISLQKAFAYARSRNDSNFKNPLEADKIGALIEEGEEN